MKRSFFLGAGFSKALNPKYPTLAELSLAVVSSFQASYPAGAVREHFDQLPNGLRRNIEQLLTYLYSDWPWKSSVESDLDIALYKALVFEIAAVLEATPMTAIPEASRQFIHFIRTLGENSIISLNYDNLIERYRYPMNYGQRLIAFDLGVGQVELVIEEVFSPNRKTSRQTPWLAEKGKSAPDRVKVTMFAAREWIRQVSLGDFKEVVASLDPIFQRGERLGLNTLESAYLSLNRFEDFYPVERPASLLGFTADPRQVEGSTGKVIHLHGSVDWRGDAMGPTIRLPDAEGSGRLEKLPAIVPPVMDKSRHYAAGRIRDQWVRAHSAIQRSQEIVIIGFSFPLTDISCSFLFKSAVAPGTRVVVVDRDSSESFIGRYKSIFEDVKNIDLDFSFLGGDDSLSRYIHSEVLRGT